jgi:hypothetical protein
MGARRIGALACTEHLQDGRMRFVRPYTIEVDWHGGILRVRIPEGMCTDGSSIPVLFRWLFPKDCTRQAGFVHDRLYWNPTVNVQWRESWDGWSPRETTRLTKGQCDVVWGLVANAGEGRGSLPGPLCWLAVAGLWAFGWFAWWGHRHRDEHHCSD